ncbi:histidinol-phosphate transaminase [Alkalilimnicola ehrlichii]|uniref:Histidinol-phosphate aminotransferase n=1 Tax=Alkalilimnicola ehrlichii TaxID=351052 RepID=A0A3E0WMF7_9GAMM|nr:histidinol-phosphate transaminase [Alkalilimnicola ehrlichii]RFA27757.1 histidinol-phosphate transaminase [Alkalilimnicola ehrlichii]RFA33599.1 histidinol-phosphate transaminase [Alkalilimnicola ehrlichii]
MKQSMPDYCDLAAPGVRGLQPYQPGKPMAELEREYGLRDVIKLASNENPLGPSPKALAAAEAALKDLHWYPDGNGFELKTALAAHHRVDPACITLGNGSNDCLDLIARTFLGPGREALFAQHAFAIYAIAAMSAGAKPVAAPALAIDSSMPYGHDLDALVERIGPNTAVVFVANPNNPTGTWLQKDELERFLAAVPPKVIVVLDEAYIEYALEAEGYPDATQWLAQMPNLIVTRTFSKAYGLAGLRIGYSVSSAAVADLLNRVRHPFNANSLAQVAACAALGDEAHIAAAVELNREEKARVADACAGLGLPTLPSAGNFLCVQVGAKAMEVNEGLLRRGVIVRPIGGYRMPEYLRISIGLPHENDRCLHVLRELGEHGLLTVRER